jgi:thioesterase superfamily protein
LPRPFWASERCWGIYAFRLAEFLNYPGPIFLIHSNLDEAAGVGTIQEMVHRYLPHMLAAWPTGPFRLAGYCHGGLTAWEIAHQLEQARRTVEKIIMIDSFSINARAAARCGSPAVGGKCADPEWRGAARARHAFAVGNHAPYPAEGSRDPCSCDAPAFWRQHGRRRLASIGLLQGDVEILAAADRQQRGLSGERGVFDEEGILGERVEASVAQPLLQAGTRAAQHLHHHACRPACHDDERASQGLSAGSGGVAS